jgi:organic radical activating enzyme
VGDQAFKRGHLRVSGDGIFYTIQGEGITQGIPAIFLRLHECNLRCKWGPTICDASYTWNREDDRYWQESKDITVESLAQDLWQAMQGHDCYRIVITGGEPMMQRGALDTLLRNLFNRLHPNPMGKIWIEFETNGTIPPTSFMKESAQMYLIQFNVSPKLATSGNSAWRALRPDALKEFAATNSWFKFVVDDAFDEDEIAKIVDEVHLNPMRVILMPQGVDPMTLWKNQQLCADIAMKRGWRMTTRLQIALWGNTRGT